MPSVKIVISYQKPLFDQIKKLARRMKISRRRLFGMAVEAFIQQYQSRALLEDINQAYSDKPDPAEQSRLSIMRKQYSKIVEGEW